MTGYLFESTDASAPVLSSTAGDRQSLLRAVLINGYGAKSGLGWTEEYSSGTTSVFKNAGTGHFLWVDDAQADGAACAMYENMTGVLESTGTKRNPINATYYLHIRNADGPAMPWKIIGDDKGFWFMCQNRYTQSGVQSILWTSHFFGDYEPWNTTNRWNSMLFGQLSTYSANLSNYTQMYTNDDDYYYIMRKHSSGEFEPDLGGNLTVYPGLYQTTGVYYNYSGNMDYFIGDAHILCPIYLAEYGVIPSIRITKASDGMRKSDWDTITTDPAECQDEFTFTYGDKGYKFLMHLGNGRYFYNAYKYGAGWRYGQN